MFSLGQPNDLCGVNRDVIEHSLNVDLAIRPGKQM
jgi:hypothetical protein